MGEGGGDSDRQTRGERGMSCGACEKSRIGTIRMGKTGRECRGIERRVDTRMEIKEHQTWIIMVKVIEI